MILDPTVEQVRRLGCSAANEAVTFPIDRAFMSLRDKEYFMFRPDKNGAGDAYRPSPENEHFRQFEDWNDPLLRSRLAAKVVADIWTDPRVAQRVDVGQSLSF